MGRPIVVALFFFKKIFGLDSKCNNTNLFLSNNIKANDLGDCYNAWVLLIQKNRRSKSSNAGTKPNNFNRHSLKLPSWYWHDKSLHSSVSREEEEEEEETKKESMLLVSLRQPFSTPNEAHSNPLLLYINATLVQVISNSTSLITSAASLFQWDGPSSLQWSSLFNHSPCCWHHHLPEGIPSFLIRRLLPWLMRTNM